MRRKLVKSGELIDEDVSDGMNGFSLKPACNIHKALWRMQDDEDDEDEDDDDMVL